jgi:hypothetical protein
MSNLTRERRARAGPAELLGGAKAFRLRREYSGWSARCYPDRVTAPRSIRFDHIIFKRDALRVVLRKPCFSSVDVGEHLQMIGVADLLARVDVDEDCHYWSLFSFRCAPSSRGQGPKIHAIPRPMSHPRIPRSGNKMRKRKARMPAP